MFVYKEGPKFSASIICMDQCSIKDSIQKIEQYEKEKGIQIIDTWHVDLMDGHFVPRIGLAPEIIRDIKKISNKPIEVHCMLSDVEPYLELFAEYGADIISFHYEGHNNIVRTVDKIHKLNMKAWIIYNLQTPINPYVSTIVDGIEFMSINPGVLGSSTHIDIVVNKIKNIKGFYGGGVKIHNEYAIDGGVRWNTIDNLIYNKLMYMVAGSGVLFNNDSIENNLDKLLSYKIKYNNGK